MAARLPMAGGRGRRAGALRWYVAAGVALLALTSTLAAPAGAASDWRHAAREQLEPNTLVRPPDVTLEQAANMVRRETGGRVLSASPSERGGRRGYDIRVLLDGKRVKSYFVDDQGRIRPGD